MSKFNLDFGAGRAVDSLFTTQEERDDMKREKVVDVSLDELHPFRNHPFKVQDDEKMLDTAQSVRDNGVLVPIIARPLESGGYEIVSGHRRHRASQLAGLDTVPVLIRELDDDTATIIMVDSNLQREQLLPSEKAYSYKMKLDAMKRQGKRNDLTLSQLGTKLRSDQELANQTGESRNQVQRYIRLTNLIPELIDMTDNNQLGFSQSVEISYLKPDEQQNLVEAMDTEQCTPSLSQAQRMKKFSAENKCTLDVMCAILSEEKKTDLDRVTFKNEILRQYFPKSYTPKKMEETILKLLEGWKKRQHEQSR